MNVNVLVARNTRFSSSHRQAGAVRIPISSDIMATATYKIVLLRHGESTWNKGNRLVLTAEIDTAKKTNLLDGPTLSSANKELKRQNKPVKN